MLRFAITLILLGYCKIGFALTAISIQAESITSDQGAARNASLVLDLNAAPKLSVATDIKLTHPPFGADWLKASMQCSLPTNLALVSSSTWVCPQGNVSSARFHLPFHLTLITAPHQYTLDLNVNNASFSDEAGLHAAEKLSARLQLALSQQNNGWRWQNTLDWTAGEMYWQPFYIASSGHQLQASGLLAAGLVKVDAAKLAIKDVAQINFNGQLRLSDYRLMDLDAEMQDADLASAYPLLFKPLLDKTAFNNAALSGKASLKVSIREAALQAFELRLNNVDIVDNNNKFALYAVNAVLPWRDDEARPLSLRYSHGSLLNLPLGATVIDAEINRYALTAPNIRLPILDGALELSGVSAARVNGSWHWHLAANLTPIAMPAFSSALGLPRMEGAASAEIPLVTYSDGILTSNGETALKVFAGNASVSHLIMRRPLGNAPELEADMHLRHLDLGDLTRTFSFGAIEGKLDGDLNHLLMQNWQPVSFDASFQSSPGSYPKKISQRAVENISALGGAGAAAAIQRSFLRFLKEFNYDKIGLSCRLSHDVCKMGGITSTDGAYVIVKGRGIPAITVMGYNQSVGWSELLGRIKRITDANAKAVVQ